MSSVGSLYYKILRKKQTNNLVNKYNFSFQKSKTCIHKTIIHTYTKEYTFFSGNFFSKYKIKKTSED